MFVLSKPFQGGKGLPRTNTLAYYKNPYITDVKSFIVQAHVTLTVSAVVASVGVAAVAVVVVEEAVAAF